MRAMAVVIPVVLALGYVGSIIAMDPRVDPQVTTLEESLADAAAYLDEHNAPDGRFTYQINLDHDTDARAYNVLRHAGSIYGLSMYYAHSGDAATRDTMLRAGRYLLRHHVKDVRGLENTKAVFSLPPEEASGHRKAKLGGTALGIIALVEVRKVDPELVPLEDLQQLGNFILFMQEDDGHFRSKYSEVVKFKVDFNSLYYPGETILALTRLYETDGDTKWLRAALEGVRYLVDSRAGTPVNKLVNDHWLMIAVGALGPHFDVLDDAPISRADAVAHVKDIATMMMREQRRTAWVPGMRGSFSPDGAITPCSTRLEGMIAVYNALEDSRFRTKLRRSIASGTAFILKGQVRSGKGKGGFLRAIKKLPGASEFNEVQSEIRIDYVQHAISAIVGYRRMLDDDDSSG